MININIDGYDCIFDEDDAWIFRYKISAIDNGKGHIRLVFTSGELHGKYVSRVLVSTPSSLLIDHINRNPLDNRKCNLRHATHKINANNAGSHFDKKDPLPVGVVRHKDGRFKVRITIAGVRKHLGYFDTVEEAAKTYERYAVMFKEGWHNGA